jgi:8-oxo-dGTP pyrophosphatase MutT (NUDIX family)
MELAQPGPGEEANAGPPTVPRLAATVILLREGTDGFEVLLVKRNPEARFMGGAWVFPGGAVNPVDGLGEEGLRAAAVREVTEEAGITLASPAALVPYSRWITPEELKIRFDTWFYLAEVEADAKPRVDGAEVVDGRWYAPGEALARARRGSLLLVFPTVKHLEQISGFDSAAALIAHARRHDVRPVIPRVVSEGEVARIVLPGEEGY